MLRKRLVVINTVIISVVIGILIINSIGTLKRLFYYESTLIYEAQLNEKFKTVDALFTAAKNFALEACVHNGLQKQLSEKSMDGSWSVMESTKLKQTIRSIDKEHGSYTLEVYPVNIAGELFRYSDIDQRYIPAGKTMDEYDVDRDFLWTFRPQDDNCIQVSRKMFSLEDGKTVLAIVAVDINISPLSEIFSGSYKAENNTFTNLYLLDQEERVLLPYHVTHINMNNTTLENIEQASYELRNQIITVVKRFPVNNWMMVGQIEGSSLLAGSHSFIEKTLVWGIALIIIAIVLTLIATKILTDPILRLTKIMENIDVTQNHEHITIGNAKGEAEILYNSFNRMMQMIKEQIKEIQLANERERENEFLLLQSQINPHFLYNTLDAIGWMAMKYGAYEIQEIVLYLVGMFRNSLSKRDALTLVRHEIEHVRCYLNIMQIRYPNAYVIEFDIEEGIEDYVIVRHLLQPLAENALQHGIYDQDNSGKVLIRAYRKKEDLIFQVINDGKLVDLAKVYKILNGDEELTTQHYGIRNVNERLKNYYGDNSNLKFTIDGDKTVATIKLPISKIDIKDGGQQLG